MPSCQIKGPPGALYNPSLTCAAFTDTWDPHSVAHFKSNVGALCVTGGDKKQPPHTAMYIWLCGVWLPAR